jgi:hypothetical protein
MPYRSPVLFWLLIAATLCVDAVAISLIVGRDLNSETATFFLALAYGQLSILCVQVVLTPGQPGFRLLRTFFAGVIAGYVLSAGEPHSSRWDQFQNFVAFVALMWIHVATALVLIWLLKPSKLCAGLAPRTVQRRWQFSTMQLLVLTTVLAALLGVLRHAGVLADHIGFVVGLTINNLVLLFLVVWGTSKVNVPIFIRLAFSLLSALLVAIVGVLISEELSREINPWILNILQAGVLWAWLEWMRSTPKEIVGADAENMPQ